MTLAREIHGHLTTRMNEISVHVAAARAAMDVGSLPTWRAAMRVVSEAAAEAMHGLRATLMVLRDDATAPGGTGDGADAQLRTPARARRRPPRRDGVSVTVEGRLPEPLRAHRRLHAAGSRPTAWS